MPEKPQLNDKEVGGLQRILSLLDPQNALTKADFTKAFKALTDYVKNIDQRNAQQFTQIASTLTQFAQKLKDDTTNDATNFKNEASTTIQTQLTDLQTRIAAHDARIAALKDGNDGKDAEPETITQEVITRLSKTENRAPITDGPEEIRNKLELLQGDERLDKSAIKGLDELDKKITEVAARPSGGGGISRIGLEFAMSKMIKHEKFTTSSATTTITLANKVSGNVVIWARYNGQVMTLGTNYTVSGKTITPSFTLDDSSEWEFTYFTA